MPRKITSVQFLWSWNSGDPSYDVIATCDDGSRRDLFSFRPSEMGFEEREFLGLTDAEALKLYMQAHAGLGRIRARLGL